MPTSWTSCSKIFKRLMSIKPVLILISDVVLNNCEKWNIDCDLQLQKQLKDVLKDLYFCSELDKFRRYWILFQHARVFLKQLQSQCLIFSLAFFFCEHNKNLLLTVWSETTYLLSALILTEFYSNSSSRNGHFMYSFAKTFLCCLYFKDWIIHIRIEYKKF